MITIGIAGGVASGKSVVADQLRELGAFVVDGDRLGHQVLLQPEVISAAKARWGESVIGTDGQIDRAAVARLVFGDNESSAKELEYWESCTHPRITELLKQHLSEQDDDSVLVLDAPVMFKAGWDKLCDQLIFVDCPCDQRMERALKRKNWNKEQFEKREGSQLSIDEKRRRASFVIDNSGSLEQTYEQVLSFWNSLSR